MDLETGHLVDRKLEEFEVGHRPDDPLVEEEAVDLPVDARLGKRRQLLGVEGEG